MRCLSIALFSAFAFSVPAWAKLPALNDDAKAKAAEAAAKAAHGNKVADFQLCKSMDKTANKYYASMKAASKETKPPSETPACADPGPFVMPAPAGAPAAAPAAAAPAAPAPAATAAPAAPAKKS
ncbi:MAG: hypothetical protein ABL900_04190 [Burkholderiaceae bacterium]